MGIIANKYEVITELGSGGTGVVYLVRHLDLDVNYALKLLNRDLSEDQRFIESFKQEAGLLLNFHHPGTTQLRDFGKTDDGLYYLAMDYCDGTPLNEVLTRDGPYSVRGALEVVVQILDVLSAAHREKIIHRDIKPDNILIEEPESGGERVRILDFGTAVVKKQIVENSSDEIVGTPLYMSPEQAAGDTNLDWRTDIYSTGIVLYELLTGAVPFDDESVVKTLLMHVTQPPAPFAERYGISPDIEKMVLKSIEKKRENRFKSADDFKAACEEALQLYKKDGIRKKEAPKAETKKASSPIKKHVVQEEKKKTKILCLDDNEMILHILEHILEKEGYEVFTAVDCSAIHGYLFEHNIDLLVSDVQMPGMPGTKVCRLLKKSMKDLKVVLFSNIPERELEKKSKENMADGWISKHKKPDEWLFEIQKVLEQKA